MAIVKFDVKAWREVFPGYEKLTDAQIEWAFQAACMLCDNTETSPFPYDPERGIETRRILLWYLVCHLATLALRPPTQSGPMSNATEGSVTLGVQLPQGPDATWYKQTTCGFSFWELAKKWVVGGRYYSGNTYHPWG